MQRTGNKAKPKRYYTTTTKQNCITFDIYRTEAKYPKFVDDYGPEFVATMTVFDIPEARKGGNGVFLSYIPINIEMQAVAWNEDDDGELKTKLFFFKHNIYSFICFIYNINYL